ncbi:MAG: hypothetical protein AAFY08_16750 [Planctomycetota bacterium]
MISKPASTPSWSICSERISERLLALVLTCFLASGCAGGDAAEQLPGRLRGQRRQRNPQGIRIAELAAGGEEQTDAGNPAQGLDRRLGRVVEAVEVVEDDGSGPQRKVYEAESLETLLRLHPELKGKVGR